MAWIAIIPARGGSKGIPGKNLALCGGKPLLQWTAEAALGSACFERVFLSTDESEIRAMGICLGLEAPNLRPPELARDDTPMLPVIRHVLADAEKSGLKVDGVALLQPTSPLRTAVHIRHALTRFKSQNVDALVSVVEVPHAFNPLSVLRREEGTGIVSPAFPSDSGTILRRQDKPPVFARNGPAILLLRRTQVDRESFYSGKTLGFEMDAESSIDVDLPRDLAYADWLLRRATS